MSRRRKGSQVTGWINFYKPLGISSTQAVSKIRYLFDAQKAGHAGTLDPLAQGVLPIALGEATKTIPFSQDDTKIYAFKVQWG
ncbi:MAG: tRNA pseudouridine(55) synthase TruB, partial [Pseudobdellovibrionaceae bacterium]